METHKVSELVDDMRPVWNNFIRGLGYSDEQAETFASGYEEKLAELPLTEKLRALAQMHDACMKSGFDAAGIDEDEAHERFRGDEA